MAKNLDREALIKSFKDDAEKAQERIANMNERRPALAKRLADLDERIATEQTKIDDLAKKIEWANSFPGTDNVKPVVSDESFGDATVADEDGEQDFDEASGARV